MAGRRPTPRFSKVSRKSVASDDLKPRATNYKSEFLTSLIIHRKRISWLKMNNSEITFWSIPTGHSFIFYKLSLWSTFFLDTDTQDSGRIAMEVTLVMFLREEE